jgi:hypothetical protein
MDASGASNLPPHFSRLSRNTETSLLQRAGQVRSEEPEEYKMWSISSQNLQASDQFFLEIKKWAGKNGKFIYAIQAKPGMSPQKIRQTFVDASDRMKRDGRNCSRLNEKHVADFWLYVGRSEKLHSRMKEHFGHGSKSTYSLQMIHWSESLELQLELHCARYREDIHDLVLQSLEDQLWDDLRPMFGRRGPR